MANRKRKEKVKGLHIIIVGCGKVGSTLVDRLTADDHDVTVIDQDAATIQAITDRYDVSGLIGNGASYAVQEEADVEHADVLIAVTASDELNLLCCMVAKRAGKCDLIARVRTPEYLEEAEYLKEQLGLAMIINPDQAAAQAVARVLFTPTALSVDSFAGGHADLIRLKLPEDNRLVGKRIMDLEGDFLSSTLICAVGRGNEVFIPDGSFVLQAGDVIAVLIQMRKVRSFLHQIGFQTHRIHNTLLLGGGRCSYYLARALSEHGVAVTIVEKNTPRCVELSELLPNVVVINGNPSNEDQLREVGIDTAESIVALTDLDEENILLSLHAREVSNAKLVTKVDRITFQSVIQELDLGSVVFPETITSEAIMAYVRTKAAQMHSDIETLVRLFDGKVEAVEFFVGEDAKVVDTPLSDLKLKENVLVTCINHGGKIIIPSGNTTIASGDTVIVTTSSDGLNRIDDVLA